MSKAMTEVRIQLRDFSTADEIARLEQDNLADGAVVTFSGRVRQQNLNEQVSQLHLEHYPGMTEKSIADIIGEARQRWSMGRVRVIHRVGSLSIGENIVFVGVTSKHRQDAFAACEFIMDYLKVQAPFWKKERTDSGERWLEARQSDHDKASNW